MSSSIVSALALTKRYNGHTAVDAIDFSVNRGECFGFLGPNGAGKTSTMRMIYCATPPTSGELTVGGIRVGDTDREREIKKKVGVIPQENNLDEYLSVIETLITFCRFYGIKGKAAVRRAEELIGFVQLEEKRNTVISQLSGGMKRRALIARSLIGDPEIVVLDEPTTGLDPHARQALWQHLRKLKASGKTLLLTTHYMEEAEALCDRLVLMDGGKIIAAGSPKELIDTYAVEEQGLRTGEIKPRSSLEEVFLKIIHQHEKG